MRASLWALCLDNVPQGSPLHPPALPCATTHSLSKPWRYSAALMLHIHTSLPNSVVFGPICWHFPSASQIVMPNDSDQIHVTLVTHWLSHTHNDAGVICDLDHLRMPRLLAAHCVDKYSTQTPVSATVERLRELIEMLWWESLKQAAAHSVGFCGQALHCCLPKKGKA
jgi:hypothetical protein